MKYSQKSHLSAGYHNLTIVLFTLLCVLICGSLSLSLKAQTKTSDEHVTPKTVPGRNGKIAFTSTRDGDVEIYTIEADGSNQTRLTNNPGFDGSPKWSPDGTKIAFVRVNGFQIDRYVMNADGSNQTRLIKNVGLGGPPDWSPDGTRIVFEFESGAVNSFTREIFVVNADGTNLTQLTNSGRNSAPQWSPDGTRIVFIRFGSTFGIYVMNTDGSNQMQLTNSRHDYFPRWSPDSSRITFHSYRDDPSPSTCNNCNVEIYSMNADGSNQTRLTNNPRLDISPEWSPDGTRIMFLSSRDNNINIYVMNADGTSQTRLTNYTEGLDVVSPIFSPDGTRIMFSYGYDFAGELITSQIYVMNADGSNLVRLTKSAADVYEAELDWQALSLTSPSCPNPIDCAEFFVRQHYLDFLSREPDPTGLAFWTNEISSCGADAQCVAVKRQHVSAAFFISIEFQETGFLVYKTFGAAFGATRAGSTVPLTLAEFLPDVQRVSQGVVVGTAGWEAQLEANQTAYFNEFVSRPAFVSAYPTTLTSAQFVDSLNANAGGALSISERDQLVNELSSGAKTRAQVLRAVVDDADFTRAHFNRAFVLMQYFAYLRRNPNDAPDNNFAGYNFWLTKLDQFNGNFVQAEMVKAFITSTEYRQRFGP